MQKLIQTAKPITSTDSNNIRHNNTAPQQNAGSSTPDKPLSLNLEWQESRCRIIGGLLTYELDILARERGALRVLLFACHESKSHTDKLDLFRSQARSNFAHIVSRRFQVPAERVEQELEEILIAVRKMPPPAKQKTGEQTFVTTFSEAERQDAQTWLSTPGFFDDIPYHCDQLGYVGEDGPKQIAYLCASSRKLEHPIPLIVRATSAAGKSALLEIIAKLMPDEEVMYLSELTKQALYYLTEERIRHKLIIVDERKGSEEADYAIRTLLSRGLLRKATPVKDAGGEIHTIIIELKGPIGYMESTTDAQVDQENENRCLMSCLDDSKEQTRRIHHAQREYFTAAGREKRRKAEKIIRRHKVAQMLLKPCKVDIAYVHLLTFPDHFGRTRRDHHKFLGLLSTITYLHQYQRKQYHEGKDLIVVADIKDYEIAYRLAPLVLRPAVSDLSDKHHELLTGIDNYIQERTKNSNLNREDVLFTRAEMANYLGWQLHQIKSYLPGLLDMEYLCLIGSGNKGTTFKYRRNYAIPTTGDPLAWLISPQKLQEKIEKQQE